MLSGPTKGRGAPCCDLATEMTDDDAELLDRIRKGATDDFAEIVRRHQSFVFGILYRYERDAHRVEDLAQETFVKVWRALDDFDGRVPLQHWISRIAVNVALDHLRKQKRLRNEVGLADLGENALDWLRADDEANELDTRQARELLELSMRELSPPEQLVITLQEIEGRSVKEISALTGSSGVAVRVRALRGRNKLRKALERLEKEAHERAKIE
jgi:RNA polymerase sigma-70 factor (ECF subfamily)